MEGTVQDGDGRGEFQILQAVNQPLNNSLLRRAEQITAPRQRWLHLFPPLSIPPLSFRKEKILVDASGV